MSSQVESAMTSSPKMRNALVLAEFADVKALLSAAEKVRDAGYKKFDCYSPFPVHGLDAAMGEKQSPLGWIVGIMALLGGGGALLLQWWTSAVDYPLIISGKPLFSFEAFVPIIFELTVLLSAFGAVFGMFALNKMPRLYHPIFNSDRFRAATDGGFFVGIEAEDAKFEVGQVKQFLTVVGATHVEVVEEEMD